MQNTEKNIEVLFWGPMNSKVGTHKSQKHSAYALRQYGYSTSFISFFDEYNKNDFDTIYVPSRILRRLLQTTKNLFAFRLCNLLMQIWFCFFLFRRREELRNRRLIIHGSLSNLIPGFFLWLMNVKMIISIQGLPNFFLHNEKRLGVYNWRYIEGYLRRAMWKVVYRLHLCYAISSGTSLVLNETGINCIFIPNAVILNKQRYKKLRDSKKIAIVGRISKQKNLPLIDFLIGELTDTHFEVFGEPEGTEGQYYLDRWVSKPNVTYYGFNANVFHATNAFYLMQLSLWEDAALVPIEAKYAGMNVVYSNYCNGIEDLIIGDDLEIDITDSYSNILNQIRKILNTDSIGQKFNDIYNLDYHGNKLRKLIQKCQEF